MNALVCVKCVDEVLVHSQLIIVAEHPGPGEAAINCVRNVTSKPALSWWSPQLAAVVVCGAEALILVHSAPLPVGSISPIGLQNPGSMPALFPTVTPGPSPESGDSQDGFVE